MSKSTTETQATEPTLKRKLFDQQVEVVGAFNRTEKRSSDFHIAACKYMELEMLIRAEEKKTDNERRRIENTNGGMDVSLTNSTF